MVSSVLAATGAASSSGEESTEPPAGTEVDGTEASAQPAELVEASLRLDWTWLAYHMAFRYALDQGYYEANGIDLTITEGQGSGTTVQLVGSGENTFGFADSSSLVQGISEGIEVINVALIWRDANFGVSCYPDAEVDEPLDLEGKSVLLIPSENVSAVWPAFLAATGVDESQIQIRNADYSNKISLFASGQADCMAGVIGQDTLLAQLITPEIEDGIPWSDYGVSTLGHGLITQRELVESDPELVQGFVDASLQGWREICADPQLGIDLYLELFPNAAPEEREFATRNLPYECSKTEPREGDTGEAFGPTEVESWQTMIDLLEDSGGLENAPAAEDVFTNDFVS